MHLARGGLAVAARDRKRPPLPPPRANLFILFRNSHFRHFQSCSGVLDLGVLGRHLDHGILDQIAVHFQSCSSVLDLGGHLDLGILDQIAVNLKEMFAERQWLQSFLDLDR